MEEYADAVVGVPGEGLNVEQRKRLTVGVELAAKPELLSFLDETTSDLDFLGPEPPLDTAQVPRDPSHYGITVKPSQRRL
ncbi:ABC transporter PDR type [Penicillium frequentans]|uniref:ABC transporter PDR type n=1 Tax=Penicillium frequentans TaxID=3151616 RepID=A0AAD6CM79_9EURO|nr:ABC transporter PDR type [Penicillium glabrum]